MPEAANPYSPPRTRVSDISQAISASDAEKIRQEHLKHEASVRSVGILCYAVGGVPCFLLIFLFAGYLLGKVVKEVDEVEPRILLLGVVLFLPCATLMLFVARGLRKLQVWARRTTIVLASIGLLQFPLGTVIAGYILYLMLARQGKRIFEDDYKCIIAATPQIKYRTSLIVWIALGFLFLAPLAVLIKATMEAMH